VRHSAIVPYNDRHTGFNPRTHAECDLAGCEDDSSRCGFQSTHSRRVRHDIQNQHWLAQQVSIHALTQSATMIGEIHDLSFDVSIHALTQSATSTILSTASAELVSIHALTQSATDLLGWELIMSSVSIHALTQSATIAEGKERTQEEKFQSTHSRRVRPVRFHWSSYLLRVSIHALTQSATWAGSNRF